MQIDQVNLTQSQATAILAEIFKTSRKTFTDAYGKVMQKEAYKRELLQKQQNLSEDLNSKNSLISQYEAQIEKLQKNLRILNAARASTIKAKYGIEAKLDQIHREWITNFSARGDASLI